MSRWLLLLLGALLCSCRPTPRPAVMDELSAVRAGASAREAEQLAPQAHAHARQLEAEADRAFEADDLAGAQILSERAIAAYTRAFVLSRLAKGERRLAQAKSELDDANAELAKLDEEQKRVAAEADALELKIKVARDAVPLVPNAPASPEREAARLAAARALATEARLLCVSTRMLGKESEPLTKALAALDALDTQLAKKPEATPIDEAIRLRSECLRVLTTARRGRTRKAPAQGTADRLLSALSRAGHEPLRDDRGVVVTLPLSGNKLSDADSKRIAELGRVAKAHPGFPVLVVVHGARLGAIADAAAKELQTAGAAKVDTADAKTASPVVNPKAKGATQRNRRVEIVFIAPSS